MARRLIEAALLAALTATVLPPAAAAAHVVQEPAGGSGTGVPAESDPGSAVTWSVQPADADGPDGRVSLRYELDPGAQAQDHVVVTNFSGRPATFLLYASDGVVSDAGSFDILAGGTEPSDGGSWITLGPVDGAATEASGALQVEVPAGSSLVVPVTIGVPGDASPGDHPAGVVAELASGGGSAVQVASRVGVRVHLRVAGDVSATLEVRDLRAVWSPSWNPFAPGTVHLSYAVANAGNVRLGATGAASLTGAFGLGAGTAPVDLREVLPSQSASQEVELDAWPTVRATASVSVTPGVVGEDEVDAALTDAVASVVVWTIPWSQLALVLLVVGGVLAIRWFRRRSAARVEARIAAAVAAAKDAGSGPAETGDLDRADSEPADAGRQLSATGDSDT